MKPLLTAFLFITALVSVFVVPVEVVANPPDYTLLAPLPGLENVSDVDDTGSLLGEYLLIIYRIVISLVILLAVGAFIFGGLQYMTSVSSDKKSGGRKVIENAIIAILLATGSYLLLFLIGGQESIRLDIGMREIGRVELPGGPQIVKTPQECFNNIRQRPTLNEQTIACNETANPFGSRKVLEFKYNLNDMAIRTDVCDPSSPAFERALMNIINTECSGEIISIRNPLGTTGENMNYCVHERDVDSLCPAMESLEAACIRQIGKPVAAEDEALMCEIGYSTIGDYIHLDELEEELERIELGNACAQLNYNDVISEMEKQCEDQGGILSDPGFPARVCLIENPLCPN